MGGGSVAASGRFHLASVMATAINCNAQVAPDGSVLGVVSIVSNLVALRLSPGKIDFGFPDGSPAVARLATRPFPFRFLADAREKPSTQAIAVFDFADGSAAEVGFQVIAAEGGAVLYQTELPGFYALVPFEFGGVRIVAPSGG